MNIRLLVILLRTFIISSRREIAPHVVGMEDDWVKKEVIYTKSTVGRSRTSIRVKSSDDWSPFCRNIEDFYVSCLVIIPLDQTWFLSLCVSRHHLREYTVTRPSWSSIGMRGYMGLEVKTDFK